MKKVKTIGIIGGGSAGYLTALVLEKLLPELKVTLIESSEIPIIGVGEATTNHLVSLLHETLDIDLGKFYREVKPTWKLGIRLDWGGPEQKSFYYPFGSLYLEESLQYSGTLDRISPGVPLMKGQKSFIVDNNGEFEQFSDCLGYAYHLDNARFVRFLKKTALERNIQYVNATVNEVLTESEERRVSKIRLDDGQILEFDLYVDCSGFRSILIGGALDSETHSYEHMLFTDRAIVGRRDHSGATSIYTSSTSVSRGWMWNTPLQGEQHIGYVYSSGFSQIDEIKKEMLEHYPDLEGLREIKFKSYRKHEFWCGNVVAVGNSYGFIEPLEATGIQLIINSILELSEGN